MRCKKCNKNVSQLYNGLCTGCMSVNIKEANDQIEHLMNSSIPDGVLLNPERLNEPGGFAKMVGGRSVANKKTTVDTSRAASLKKVKKDGKKSESVSDFDILDYIKGEFTEKDKRAYKPSLKVLSKKYIVMFKRGMYSVCKASEFGQTEATGGDVVDNYGGLVVYKAKTYYDPDNIVPDSYADDNSVISVEEDDSEILLGVEVE